MNIDMYYRLAAEFSDVEKYFAGFVEEIETLYNSVEVCRTISFESLFVERVMIITQFHI